MKKQIHFLLLIIGIASTSLHGMKETFPCDWCKEEKTILNKLCPQFAYRGLTCTHVLCNDCTTRIPKLYDADTNNNNEQYQHPLFFWCSYCRAFYEEKNKVCWQQFAGGISISAAKDIAAAAFKETFPHGRTLPNKTDSTLLPTNPRLIPDKKSNALSIFIKQLAAHKYAYVCAFVGIVGIVAVYKLFHTHREKENAQDQKDDTSQEESGEQRWKTV
jgi:hypothetical protein